LLSCSHLEKTPSFFFFKHNIPNTHYQVICSFLRFTWYQNTGTQRERERQREREICLHWVFWICWWRKKGHWGVWFVCVLITQKAREICGSCFVVSCFFVLDWGIWRFCNNVKVLQFLCLLGCDWCQVQARRNS
jgi:hypothetical protein